MQQNMTDKHQDLDLSHCQSNTIKSFSGISLNSANEGEKVSIAFKLNCQDKRPEDDQIRLIADILDNYAYPEVMNRIADGRLTSDFRLHSVHMIMFQDCKRNEILLNEDVKFMPHIKYKNSKVFKVGETVNFEDVDEILGLYPDSSNDPNSGHVMLMKFRERWCYACDLIYELKTCKELCETAVDVINQADRNMKDTNWKYFLDNLLNVCMSLTQVIRNMHYDKLLSLKQSHSKNIVFLTEWANNGVINPIYSELYNKVFELRRNIKRDDVIKKEANGLLLTTSKFIEEFKEHGKFINLFQNPTA